MLRLPLVLLAALLMALPARAQSSLAPGAGVYLSVEDLDVLGGGRTGATLSAGWRTGGGSDLGVHLDAERDQSYTSTLVMVTAGHTWRPADRVGVRLAGAAGVARRATGNVNLGGAVGELEATAFYGLPLAGTVRVQPTLGLFVQGDTADRTEAPGPTRALDLPDAAGAHVGLPVAFRLLSTDLAVAPTVRLGVGLEDRAFWGDGSLRLVANF